MDFSNLVVEKNIPLTKHYSNTGKRVTQFIDYLATLSIGDSFVLSAADFGYKNAASASTLVVNARKQLKAKGIGFSVKSSALNGNTLRVWKTAVN